MTQSFSSFLASRVARLVVIAAASVALSCVPPAQGPGPRGGGSASGQGQAQAQAQAGAEAGVGVSAASRIEPGACNVPGDTGRKLRMFLAATVLLDRTVTGLYGDARNVCRAMGVELGLDQAALNGDLRALCNDVSVRLQEYIEAGGGERTDVVVKHKPARCYVNVDAAARVSAECEASAQADVRIRCDGVCQGTCNGDCAGTCASKNAAGQCSGACDGTCQGTCNGDCMGSANVDASASCKAAAEIQANVEARCDPPETEVIIKKTETGDPAKRAAAKAALAAGIPKLLAIRAKLAGPVGAAFATWTRSLSGLRDVAKTTGIAAVCVAGQVAQAAASVVEIRANISITVEASASVSAAAGAAT